MPTMPKKIHPILAYRLAVAVLLAALVAVGAAYQRQAGELADARSFADLSAYAARQERDRAARAENRLYNVESGGVIPQGTRRAMARQIAEGGTILTLELDGAGPLVNPSLPDARVRQSIIGWNGIRCGNEAEAYYGTVKIVKARQSVIGGAPVAGE